MKTILISKKVHTVLHSTTFFIIALGVFTLVVSPWLVRLLDNARFEQDVKIAKQINEAWLQTDLSTSNLALSGYEIRQGLFQDIDESSQLSPLSHNTGFFYMRETNQIVAMRFEAAFTYGRERGLLETQEPFFTTPETIFGDSLILLSRDGSEIARHVHQVYEHAVRSRFEPSSAIWRVNMSGSLKLLYERLFLRAALSSDLRVHIEHFKEHFNPEHTLFVSNHRWVTQASSGEVIRQIVFYPGLSTIPEFRLSQFGMGTIHLNEVVLPSSVRNVQKNAFPATFVINRIVVSEFENIVVEEGAMVGVDELAWTPMIINRDDPVYRLDVMFEGRPLITVTQADLNQGTILNLRHLRAYFKHLDIEVLSYNIHLSNQNIALSKVYIYTQDGYYGYVVPVLVDSE